LGSGNVITMWTLSLLVLGIGVSRWRLMRWRLGSGLCLRHRIYIVVYGLHHLIEAHIFMVKPCLLIGEPQEVSVVRQLTC